MPMPMEIPEIVALIEKKVTEFEDRKSDHEFLLRCLPVVDAVEEWKFSTGPVFDEPPYEMEMMGFSGGTLLPRTYSGIEEARLEDCYSSGFVAGRHCITIDPASSGAMALSVSLFEWDGDCLHSTMTEQPVRADPPSAKPSRLIGIAETRWLDRDTRIKVGAGSRGAFAVYLYRYDAHRRPTTVHLFSKGHSAQSDYMLHYDEMGAMTKVTDPAGNPVWSRS